MATAPTTLTREGFPEPPPMDTAVSHATLRLVSSGHLGPTLRIHRPGPVLAFGQRDRAAPGFPDAVAAAGAAGFGAVERLAGGRAAVFHEGTIAFSWALPHPSPREGIRARFDLVAGIVEHALRSIGVDARVGEIPGEYCPGEHSVNAGGRTKLAGLGQRIVAGAVHVGGVVVVTGGDRVREVLLPVNDALGIAWDPDTAGAVVDEVPGATWDGVAGALVRSFGDHLDLVPGALPGAVLDLAAELLPRHDLSVPRAG